MNSNNSFTNPFKNRYDKLLNNNPQKKQSEEEKIEVMNEENINQVNNTNIIDINDILNAPDQKPTLEYINYYNNARITGIPRSMDLSLQKIGEISISYENAISNISNNML